MADQSMRGLIANLEEDGELQRIKKLVRTQFEIASILTLRDGGRAQLFELVEGHEIPVIGNLFNKRARFARAFSTTLESLDSYCLAALDNPEKPVLIEKAPVQEIIHSEKIDLSRLLPVPHWFEKETKPYITAGVIVAKDPETQRRNVSIARLRLEDDTRLMAGIARNHHLAILAQKALSMGRKLEIAIAIGNHAAVLLGSQMYVNLGDDEYDICGSLLGEPLKLVKCLTVDLEVPAHAEIVLEGELNPEELIEEGPVSEFPGFYVNYGSGIAADISCVTHRAKPIFQAILPGYASEHCLLGALAIGTTLTRDLQSAIPAVQRVFITVGGMGRLHAVIVMHRPRLGEGKRAIMLAMGRVNLLKLVVAVEDDVDPEDWSQVEWSLAARFRGEEDMIVIQGVKADRCDPVHEDLTVTKIGLVATTRPGDGVPGSRSEFARPPAEIFRRIADTIDEF